MEEIIITMLILGAGYYFLTHQKQAELTTEEKPLTTSISTQTEPIINQAEKEEQKALESTLDELIKNIRQLNHQIK
jgi:Tfp pilus assembly protein PilO